MTKLTNVKTPSVPYDFFQTQSLPPTERFATWRDSVLPLFDSFLDEQEAASEFTAQMESFNLGNMFFGLGDFTGLRFRRDSKYKPGEDADHLLVQLYLDGGYQGHNGFRDLTVNAGDMSLLDLGKTLETRAKRSRVLSLVIPRDAIYSFAAARQVNFGTVIRKGTPMGNILSNHLKTVWENMQSASMADLHMINQTLVSSVVGAFTTEAVAGQKLVPAMESVRLASMRTYIRAHLGSTALTPEHLCRHFGCSRAQLYRMFAPLGGVSVYIRGARLNRCLEEFTRPGGDRRSIVEVALLWGFSSHSHFCRLFKQAFGISPSDAIELGRSQSISTRPPSRHESQRRQPEFHDWLRGLSHS